VYEPVSMTDAGSDKQDLILVWENFFSLPAHPDYLQINHHPAHCVGWWCSQQHVQLTVHIHLPLRFRFHRTVTELFPRVFLVW